MDTLKLHSHFENLLYVGRSVLTNTSSRIQRLFFKKEMCIYEYLFKEEASKGIEIVVDNAVLVCVFENDICNKWLSACCPSVCSWLEIGVVADGSQDDPVEELLSEIPSVELVAEFVEVIL